MYEKLKRELVINYKKRGIKNCIGSVEKVVDELFDGIDSEGQVEAVVSQNGELIDECAKICGREWDALGWSDSLPLIKEHIPMGKHTTQLETFSFINVLMGIRAQEIRKLKNDSRFSG